MEGAGLVILHNNVVAALLVTSHATLRSMALTPCEFQIDLRGLWAELLIWECKVGKSWLKFQQNQAFPCIILLLNDRLFFLSVTEQSAKLSVSRNS